MKIKRTIILSILSIISFPYTISMQMPNRIPVIVSNQSDKFVGIFFYNGKQYIEATSALPLEDVNLDDIPSDKMSIILYNGLSRFHIGTDGKGKIKIIRFGMLKNNNGTWKATRTEENGLPLAEFKKLIILINPNNSIQLISGK